MRKIIFTSLLTVLFISSYSQITIGSVNAPVEGALLDIKESGTFSNNATAKKGFALPRVFLQGKETLAPLVQGAAATDPNVQKVYTGMSVYNLSEIESTASSSRLKKGLNVWNGKEWILVGDISENPTVFYMPPFALELADVVGGTKSVNLYNKYIQSFTHRYVDPHYTAPDLTNSDFNTSEGNTFTLPGLYDRYDLYYAVLDYSDEITVTGMDNAGNLSYRTNSLTAPNGAFINIICIVKK